MDKFTIRDLTGNPGLERLELQDVNAADTTPTQDADAFPPDPLTEAEIDALYVAEMERRDREAARPAGYRDAACLACNAALYVPVGEADDVLCPACERLGNILADGDGDDPDPPASGALHPEFPHFVNHVKRWPDELLITGIGLADAGELWFAGDASAKRRAWLHAATAELLTRIDALPAAA